MKMLNFISNNILLTTIIVTLAVIAMILLAAYLKYKNVDVKGIFDKLENFLKTAETYTLAAEKLTNGKTQAILQDAEAFEKIALQGCGYAEQMLLSSQITDDVDGNKRKELAQNYVLAFLKVHGITINDDIKIIVQGIVQNTVLSDKTIDEINKKLDVLVNQKVVALTAANTALQQQITQLTAGNVKLQNANQELTQKLTSFQNTIATVISK